MELDLGFIQTSQTKPLMFQFDANVYSKVKAASLPQVCVNKKNRNDCLVVVRHISNLLSPEYTFLSNFPVDLCSNVFFTDIYVGFVVIFHVACLKSSFFHEHPVKEHFGQNL